MNRLIYCENNCDRNKPQIGVLHMFGSTNQPMGFIKMNREHGLIYNKLIISYNPGRIVYLCFLHRDTENADLLILPSERHETLKRKQSARLPVPHDSRYLPVYTTPLSSTDMLMLLVPLVVRFRAVSGLPSKKKETANPIA